MFTRIRELRIKKNLFQAELAKLAGVSINTVRRWESGERTPRSKDLERLASLFDVSIDYLICRDENPEAADAHAPISAEDRGLKCMAPLYLELGSELETADVYVISREVAACSLTGLPESTLKARSMGVFGIPRALLRPWDPMTPPYAIYSVGDRLEHDGICDGDLVVINPGGKTSSGDIALVALHNRVSLKRVYIFNEDGKNPSITLRTNDCIQDLPMEQHENCNFQIVGSVAMIIKGRPRPREF